MRIRRNIASIPTRSAAETWRAIIELVTGDGSIDRQQLEAAASIMESLIADEQPAAVPIVFKGCGPRLLVYCLYDENAMEAGLDIDNLSTNPTAGDWRMTAPCEEADVDWMNNTLKSRASRIMVHAADKPPPDDDSEGAQQSAAAIEIDWGGLSTP
jgi:hypothetical protein